LKLRGIDVGPARLPFGPLEAKDKKILEEALSDLAKDRVFGDILKHI